MIGLLAALLILLGGGAAFADSATGVSSQINLAPGLCSGSSCSTYNPGTQNAANGGLVAQQVFVAPVGSAGTQAVAGTDAGKIWIATVAGVTFSVFPPGVNGTAGANFGYDGSHSYAITSSAQIYGCGPTGTTVTVSYDTSLLTDGTNWKCTPGASGLATAAGGTASLTPPRENYFCTGACTITLPVPAAGHEFCVANDDAIATVITLAALGSGARYENTARTAYGTAGTGTMISSGAVGDKVCLYGRDSTHYMTLFSTGSWTVN